METSEFAEIRQEYRHYAEVAGKKLAAKSRRQFNAACKKSGISKSKYPPGKYEIGAHWVEVVGRPTREVPEAAKLADLTVFAGPLADYNRLIPNVLERTLLASGRPILFAPEGLSERPLAQIAIAWDASVQAARAVGAAMTFFQDAKQILVLSAKEPYAETPDPKKLVEYLAWHGISAEGQALKPDRGAVAETLLTAADEYGAELMIMGGYVHNRFEEAIFGGTTLHAIRHSQIPLFMMH
jgi:nucleotide-binding universal stress UspA family protein